jgi:hypothetical protein
MAIMARCIPRAELPTAPDSLGQQVHLLDRQRGR